MKNLVRAEILKLKGNWLVTLSFVIAFLLPFLTLAMTLFSNQIDLAEESVFHIVLRQNHIFLTLMVCNLLFSLMVTNLLCKEFQYGTIDDILSIPVKRSNFLIAKELTIFIWMMAIGLFSFCICLIIGAVFGLEGFNLQTILFGLVRYVLAVTISFIPLQLIIWASVLFKNYVISLAVSIVALVGSIVAFNTKDIIFIYPFSISFVLTNFKTDVLPEQLITSMISLAILGVICIAGIFISFNRMDIKSHAV
jgi:bacitracin transport system permease protein